MEKNNKQFYSLYLIKDEDFLYEPANLIANLYSNELDVSFQLDTEIFSKSYIENWVKDNR